MGKPKFDRFRSSANGQFYFNLKAGNGEITLSSEGYTSEQSLEKGIDSVRRNAPYDERYERKYNNDSYTFNLKASNGEVIGRSESYTSSYGRDQGIESVKRDAPDAS